MNTFVKTRDILIALETAIAAIQLPASYSQVPDYPKAFVAAGVKVYGTQDLFKALADLLVFDDRACFIVPGGDTHDTKIAGNVMSIQRKSEVHLLIADRNYDKFSEAGLIGETNVNPGVAVLKDLVIDALLGQSLANLKTVALAPTSGEPLHLTDRKQSEDNPGRYCWALTFTTYAGQARIAIR
jgi:hypothetical protein